MHSLIRAAASLACLAAAASAQVGASPAPGPGGGPNTPGDSPLVSVGTFTGNLGVAVEALPFSGSSGSSGVFTLSGIPAGANVVQAWLYITAFDFSSSVTVTADFDGVPLGAMTPTYEDADLVSFLYCSAWRYDVTSLIAGDGAYAYSATGHSNAYGDALVVVYQHPSLPARTIAVHDGAEGLRFATTSTTYTGLPAASGTLTLFTEADDDGVGLGEQVDLNGTTVAGPGPLFQANLGSFASLVDIPVMTVAGANTLDVTTDEDYFGLHLAILSLDGTSCGATASASFRNAGANPASLTTGLPQLGSELTASVDLTTTGHTFAVLAAYAGTLTFTLPGGQVLLHDITDPSGELLAVPVTAGPVADFSLAVPADPGLCGFFASFQAAHVGGVVPFALSNAQDLTLGF